jgi:hypothetical protein
MAIFNRSAALAMLLLAVFVTPANAGTAGAIADGIPANVTEVTTGGSWSKDNQTGTFRAIVVMTGEKEPQVNVFVQLLAFEKDSAVSKVVKTLVVKEVEDRKLQSAFVNFDAENPGKATLIITSYDAEKDSDNSIYAEVTADGTYRVVEAPKEEAPADAEAANKKP